MRLSRLIIAVLCLLGAFIAPKRVTALQSSDAAAVTASYNAEFRRLEPAAGWNGHVATCNPGTTNQAYRDSVLQRVNWFRALAGLPPVKADPSAEPAAQAAALAMSANKSLTHSLPSTATCYSAAAELGAARSNLALGISGVSAIDAYMDDFGANNTAVGHRQWILSSTLGTVATGDVPDPSGVDANALYVVSPTVAPSTPPHGFTAWPPPGYFPDELMIQRWSFSAPGLSATALQNATVALSGPAGNVPVSIVHNTNTIVWEAATSITEKPGAYTVAIRNVAHSTAAFDYTVNVIDVEEPLATPQFSTEELPRCATIGHIAAIASTPGTTSENYTYSLVDGYADNTFFKIRRNFVVTRTALDPTRDSYTLKIRAVTPTGSAMEQELTLTAVDDSSQTCPPRAVSITATASKVTVRWSAPTIGRKPLNYSAVVNGVSCSTKRTSCSFSRITPGKKTTVRVTANYRTGSFEAPAVRITIPRSGITTYHADGSVTTAPLLVVAKRYSFAKLLPSTALSESTTTRAAAGACKLTKDRRTVITTKRGTCTLTLVTPQETLSKKIKVS